MGLARLRAELLNGYCPRFGMNVFRGWHLVSDGESGESGVLQEHRQLPSLQSPSQSTRITSL
jgi:hypothetical protein